MTGQRDSTLTLVETMEGFGLPASFTTGLLKVIEETQNDAVNLGLETGVRMGYDAAIIVLELYGLASAAPLKSNRDIVMAASAEAMKVRT